MEKSLQSIFALCVLVIWALFAFALRDGNWTTLQWGMLIAAHLACLIVFYRFTWIFSYGYALSMLAVSLWLIAQLRNAPAYLLGGLCAAYGARLGHFVFTRARARAARGEPDTAAAAHRSTPLVVKILLWIMVSWLMAFLGMSVWLVGTRGQVTVWLVAGAIVMVLGLGLETLADNEKQLAKATAPQRWVDSGVFARMRQANYSGEILFQLGLMLAVVGTARDWREYLLCWIGPLYVCILMVFQSQMLDRSQLARYGADPQYRAWRERSGRLLPF